MPSVLHLRARGLPSLKSKITEFLRIQIRVHHPGKKTTCVCVCVCGVCVCVCVVWCVCVYSVCIIGLFFFFFNYRWAYFGR